MTPEERAKKDAADYEDADGSGDLDLEAVSNALAVLMFNHATRSVLEQIDPKAVEQARSALGLPEYQPVVDDEYAFMVSLGGLCVEWQAAATEVKGRPGMYAVAVAYQVCADRLGDMIASRKPVRYLAEFNPQAWVNDNAIPVDKPGPNRWDVTEFFLNELTEHQRQVILAQEDDGDGVCLDVDDLLWHDTNAPEWVQGWQGPFSCYLLLRQDS